MQSKIPTATDMGAFLQPTPCAGMALRSPWAERHVLANARAECPLASSHPPLNDSEIPCCICTVAETKNSEDILGKTGLVAMDALDYDEHGAAGGRRWLRVPLGEREHAEWFLHRSYVSSWWPLLGQQGIGNALDFWEAAVRTFPDRPCVQQTDGRAFSYKEMEGLVTAAALKFKETFDCKKLLNVAKGVGNAKVDEERSQPPVLAMLAVNSALFLVYWLAAAKLGFSIALLNNVWCSTGSEELSLKNFAHSIKVAGAVGLIVDSECARTNSAVRRWCADEKLHGPCQKIVFVPNSLSDAVQCESDDCSLSDEYSIIGSFDELHEAANALEPAKAGVDWPGHHLSMDDPLLLIFTSGTSGPPKAAYFSHRRFIGAGLTWAYSTRMGPLSSCYVCIPLFHGNGGVVAVSTCWMVGASIVVRRKFSVSNFWKEMTKFSVSHMIYIGQLWRYLLHATASTGIQESSLRTIFGNGLTEPLWEGVRCHFPFISRIIEHYGMTEMPSGPLMNINGRPGSVGFVPPSFLEKVRPFSLFSPSVDNYFSSRRLSGDGDEDDGSYEGSVLDTVGELAFRLDHSYKYVGYTSSVANSSKIACISESDESDRNSFQWFKTGDILHCNKEGWLYFIRRDGHSFRRNGENISYTSVYDAFEAIGHHKHFAKIRKGFSSLFPDILPFHIHEESSKEGFGAVALSIPDQLLEHMSIDDFAHDISPLIDSFLPKCARPFIIRIVPSTLFQNFYSTATLKLRSMAASTPNIDSYVESVSPLSNDEIILIQGSDGFKKLG